MDVTTPAGAKPEFLLLFRNTSLEHFSREETHLAMRRLNEWLEEGSARGIIAGGQPLGPEGKVISGRKGRAVTDGPFAEAKEVIGGYVLVKAADLDEAAKFAESWPMLDYGAAVEVRPVLALCPAMAEMMAEAEPVGA